MSSIASEIYDIESEFGKNVYFSGIGGIGMSGIALLLKNFGFNVTGSDITETYVTSALAKNGIEILFSQNGSGIVSNIDCLIRSSAIKNNHPEIIKAKELGIKIISRGDALAKICAIYKNTISVAGTHGKTTTTSLCGKIFDIGGKNPTVINGGVMMDYGSNLRLGGNEYIVTESDESDGSFVKIPTKIGVILNIEEEHMDFYKTKSELIGYFEKYIMQIPDDGFCLIYVDDKIAGELYDKLHHKKNNLISISQKKDNTNIRIFGVKQNFDHIEMDLNINDIAIENIKLSAFGVHNAINFAAAVGVGYYHGIRDEGIIKKAALEFKGTKRRFTKVGENNGILFIDDYAHHPTEIAATLNGASEVANSKNGRVIAVFQPHRLSRTKDLFDKFCKCWDKADILILDEIYKVASEEQIDINSNMLLEKIVQNYPNKQVIKMGDEKNLLKLIKNQAKDKDIVIGLGAGSISSIIYRLFTNFSNNKL